ncbi:prolyl oligopeptidase family serine peptidase [Bacteroides sp.]|uniref:prolyl oligopeptidase family serine peptidase n=1 Tax=Bacteroides sp. TaxID=29523 RepID=UPI00402A322B
MTGEDKMNRIFVYIGIIAGLLLGGSLSVEAQKKPLDIEACTSWKRIDAPDISPTGRWVTYRISLMEYNPDSKEEKKLHLFDSRTRKEILLNGDIERLEFYNNDQGAFYRLADSAGVMKTFLLSLPSGVKTEWKHKEAFRPVEGTPYSISVTNVPKDTVNHVPAFNRLVVRHLKTEVAFHIDSIGYHTLYDGGRSILFIRKKSDRNELCYGPLAGPYKTLYQSPVKSEPSSYSFNEKEMIGEFSVNDSLWYAFSLKKPGCNLLFDRKEIVLPDGMSVGRIDLSKSHNFLILELRDSQQISRRREESEKKPDKSFELELWTWNEMEVPTLQRGGRYRQDKSVTYIYDIFSKKLTEVAPFTVDLLLPSGAENLNYVLYTDESPYKMQREWLDRLPFDIYSVNVHTGAKRLIGRSYRTAPKWSVNGKWAVMYDPIAQVWNKFDGATGKVVNISDAIGYPMFMESYDKPAPAPAYGIAGWTADGNNVFLYDAYDWWKIDLTGERQPECLTKGYGRKHGKSIRKMTSNIDKDVFQKDEKVIVSLWDKDTMDEGVYQLDMKGRLRKLMEGNYVYTIHRFSDNHEYCVWNRQNVSEFRDLWWSKSDFSNPVKVTNANPQQADYKWGTVKLIKWTNYENKENKGLLYLPEDYDPQKEYPVLVQFYETHSGELNIYHAPLLSSALGDPMYFASNGYIVFMPDVHFTVGTPGQSCYDAVVSGTKYLIEQGIAHPGKIGLQGHSWSGYQTSYLVTKTDLFTCANIAAPITDMVTGYLGIRNGSGLPRYFMYEETQSRMGKTLWEAKDQYLASSAILEADKIHTPLLILHNDQDEAVAYEQGRALYLAMRRLQRPAWLLNYKGEGHFVLRRGAQKDWTIRMMQFFDYYLKGTKEPRWMKEGIHLRERGIDQKYDLLEK